MNLDTDYRLISDDYNFILQKKLPMRNKKRAQRSKEWINVGYWEAMCEPLEKAMNNLTRSDGTNKK